MIKRKLLISAAIVTSIMLSACSKSTGETGTTSVGEENSTTRYNTETTVQQTETENVTSVDDSIYTFPGKPWIIHYPSECPNETEKNLSILFTYDVKNYMVMCYWDLNDEELEKNLEQVAGLAFINYTGYCTPSITTDVTDIEGEYVEINGLNVYKFTAKVPAESASWDCMVYGYSWIHDIPETLESNGAHKYSDSGQQYQSVIVGVVSAEDQEAYKDEMMELTDYLMYHSEILSE